MSLSLILVVAWTGLSSFLRGSNIPSCVYTQFSRSVVSDSLQPHELQHTRPPCPSPTPWVYSDSRPLSCWCHPAISSSVIPFSSCLQSFPASGSFQMSQLSTSGGQSTGVSAWTSFLPKKSQGWSPSEWTGWISLQAKRLSRVFSNTTVQKHQFFSAQPSSQSRLWFFQWSCMDVRMGLWRKLRTTDDEMAGWHHQLDGHEFGWTLGVGDGQGGLAYCSSWGRRVGHDWVTELNWTDCPTSPQDVYKAGINIICF